MTDKTAILLAIVVYLVLTSTVLAMTFEGDISQITLGNNIDMNISESNFSQITNMSQIPHVIVKGIWTTGLNRGIYSVGDAKTTWGNFLDNVRDISNIEAGPHVIAFTDLTLKENTIYEINYTIYDPLHSNFTIYFYYEGKGKEHGFLVEDKGITLFGGVTDQGIRFYPIDLSSTEYFNFTTYFDTDTDLYIVKYEGNEIFRGIQQAKKRFVRTISRSILYDPYFSIVAAYGSNVEILEIDKSIQINFDVENAFKLSDFVSMVALLFFWNIPNELMPLELNILFIKVPLLIIIFIIVSLIRGA